MTPVNLSDNRTAYITWPRWRNAVHGPMWWTRGVFLGLLGLFCIGQGTATYAERTETP